jgi:drug/metabolite transporter (DMT)-like permease
MRSTGDRPDDARLGLAAAAGAAILYGAAYPATAVALRSFTPLGIAGIACTIALPFVLLAAAAGLVTRPSLAALGRGRLSRLVVLGSLGGLAFIAATNVAVALSGPTITGFVAPLYAVAAALLAVPILGERLRAVTAAAFGLALVGTILLAGVDPTATSLTGVLFAAVAAVIFGLYMVLARKWSEPYALDGTLVTIANLVGRGPILLLVELVRTSAGSSRSHRAAHDRIRLELDREPAPHRERPAGARAVDLGRAAADPGVRRGHRCPALRRDPDPPGVAGCGAHPPGHRRGDRARPALSPTRRRHVGLGGGRRRRRRRGPTAAG